MRSMPARSVAFRFLILFLSDYLSCRKGFNSVKIRPIKIMKMESAKQNNLLFVGLIVITFLVYFFSNPNPQNYYDYTFRVAENILHGHISLRENPPSWLNEFVPFEGNWYSVFPLGSVLTMIPFAFFKLIGVIQNMPAAFLAAFIAASIFAFLLLISEKYDVSKGKRILLSLGIVFGTWTWTNLSWLGRGIWHLVGRCWANWGNLFHLFQMQTDSCRTFFRLSLRKPHRNLGNCPDFYVADFDQQE